MVAVGRRGAARGQDLVPPPGSPGNAESSSLASPTGPLPTPPRPPWRRALLTIGPEGVDSGSRTAGLALRRHRFPAWRGHADRGSRWQRRRPRDRAWQPRRSLRIVEPGGPALTFTQSGGRITSITDPIGRVVRYSYDAAAASRHRDRPHRRHDALHLRRRPAESSRLPTPRESSSSATSTARSAAGSCAVRGGRGW